MVNTFIIYEATIVGLYSDIIFRLVNFIYKKSSIFSLFIVGFLKHFLGYFLRLQTIFCKYRGKGKAIITRTFLSECIIEGIVFTIMYLLIPNAFITGFLLHIISEYIGVHKLFIKYRCN